MKRDEWSTVELKVDLDERAEGRETDYSGIFRILIAGDFGGAGAPKTILVDRDNLDEAFERIGVTLEMPVAGKIRFRDLDDFHPDRLFSSLPLFEKLREARELAANSRPAPAPKPAPKPAAGFDFGSLLDDAVSATEAKAEGRQGRDPLRSWLDEKVAPHTVEAPAAGRAERLALVDQVITVQMRALLHYPAFQQLEALWRAVFFLVRRLETGPNLQIHLLDTRPELLEASLDAVTTPRRWAVVVVNRLFGAAEGDCKLLARLGERVSADSGVLLAGGAPSLIGCREFPNLPPPSQWGASTEAWDWVRGLPAALATGLVLPSVLARQPYGARTSPCEEFAFEEMGEEYDPTRLLWMNGAIVAAELLGEGFSDDAWQMVSGRRSNLEGLPMYVHGKGPDSFVAPVAETLMTVEAAEAILERGPMALATIRDTGEVRVVRFQSIAQPPSRLFGRWG